jgi:hypothetical protein
MNRQRKAEDTEKQCSKPHGYNLPPSDSTAMPTRWICQPDNHESLPDQRRFVKGMITRFLLRFL